jgi:MFS transporter, DHA1 family, multidrug resistance protein
VGRSGGPPRAESVRTSGFVGGVLLTAFAVAIGFGLIVPALPTFAVELGAGFGAASVVVATFAAVRLLCSGPVGLVVDRLGARQVVAWGLVLVAVSSGLTALARTYPELLVLRGAGGVGSAMFIVGIGQHIVRTIPGPERGRANGLLHGAFLLGGASGPAVGGLVVELLGIRAPFVVYAVALLAATLATVRYLREEGTDATAASGAAPVGAEPAAHAHAQPADSSPRLGVLLRDRTFWAALYLYAAISWSSQWVRFVAVPLLGSQVLGESIGLVGIALTVSSAAHGLVLWPASRHADSRGRLGPLRAGTAVYVVSLLGLMTVAGPVGLVVWMAVQGIANGISAPVPAAVIADLAPPGGEGRAVGMMNVARDVGSVLGPLATGYIAQIWSFDAAFLVAAVLLAGGFVAPLLMRETLEPSTSVDGSVATLDLRDDTS